MAEPAKPLVVVSRTGKIGTVDPAHARDVLAGGAREATPEEVQQAITEGAEAEKARGLADKYAGGDIAKGVELEFGSRIAGGLRGFTGGLSDVGITALGGEEARRRLVEYDEAAPVLSKGSEVSGVIAPMFAGKVPGITGRLAGGIPGLVSEVGRVGEAGAAALVGKGATSAAGRLAQRVIPGAVAGGIEGALAAPMAQASEDALGDHATTGEKLVASMGHGFFAGAAVGGLAGGVFGGHAPGSRSEISVADDAGRALETRTTPYRSAEEIRPKTIADYAEPSGPFDAVAARYIGKHAEDAEQAKLLSEAWKRRERAFGVHDDSLDRATRAVTKDLDTAVKAERAVDMASFGDSKATQMARLVPQENWRQARDAGLAVWDEARQVIETLKADPTRGGMFGTVTKAEKWLEKFGKQLGQAATSKDKAAITAEIFTSLDDFKRSMAQYAQFGKGPFGLSEAAREFDGLYHRTRGVLENESVWGKAGTAQRAINAATTARLETRRQFGEAFTSLGGTAEGRPYDRANPEKIAGYVRNLTSAKNDLKHEWLQNYIANEERFLETVDAHYVLGASEKKQIAEAREAFARMRTTLDTTSNEIAVVNQLRRLKAEEMAGGVGGALGLVTDVATRPIKTLERLASIESATRRIDETIRKGIGVKALGNITASVDSRLTGGVKAMLGPAGKGQGAPILPLAKPAIKAAPQIAGKTAADKQEAYTTRAREVTAMASNPAYATDQLAKKLGDLPKYAPKTAAAITETVVRGNQFLFSKLPPPRIDPASLTPQLQDPTLVSPMERSRFARYAHAVDDPLSVLDKVKTGELTFEEVEAVQTVYPRIYNRMREEVAAYLAVAQDAVPYTTEVQLGLLLDMPTNGTMVPSFINATQATYQVNAAEYASQATGSSGQGGKGGLATAYASAGDRIEGGG